MIMNLPFQPIYFHQAAAQSFPDHVRSRIGSVAEADVVDDLFPSAAAACHHLFSSCLCSAHLKKQHSFPIF